MFNFSKEKTKEENIIQEGTKDLKSPQGEDTPANLMRITTDVDRLKVGFESFQETRTGFNERFEMLSEQIGELRAMILDRDKIIQEIELKAIKSADLVEAVQPEKLATVAQKQEAKIEALKANIEGNESMMDQIMEEVKEMKRKIEFFRGIEEIIKLSEEVKKDLIEIKRSEAAINLKTDKVDTIYSEMRKGFEGMDLIKDNLKEIEVSTDQNVKEIESLKNRLTNFADKNEVENIVRKVQKYVDNLKQLEQKSSLTKDLDTLRTLIEGIKK
jgi:hypothetical protein